MSEIVTGARADLFRVVRAGIDTTVGALIVAAAGPCVLPDRPAAIAFVVVDEGGLAAGLLLPLMGAFYFLRQ